ncbi:hypothetical protein J6590_034102 [Homalodisca vitripennis]|nr:hypothetical protein J6590_034102 [Homalodisca vitripennis]
MTPVASAVREAASTKLSAARRSSAASAITPIKPTACSLINPRQAPPPLLRAARSIYLYFDCRNGPGFGLAMTR